MPCLASPESQDREVRAASWGECRTRGFGCVRTDTESPAVPQSSIVRSAVFAKTIGVPGDPPPRARRPACMRHLSLYDAPLRSPPHAALMRPTPSRQSHSSGFSQKDVRDAGRGLATRLPHDRIRGNVQEFTRRNTSWCRCSGEGAPRPHDRDRTHPGRFHRL